MEKVKLTPERVLALMKMGDAERTLELRTLLEKSQSKMGRKVFAYVRKHPEGVTSAQVAKVRGISISNASNLLRKMWYAGLLGREEQRDENGLLYLWHALPSNAPLQKEEQE